MCKVFIKSRAKAIAEATYGGIRKAIKKSVFRSIDQCFQNHDRPALYDNIKRSVRVMVDDVAPEARAEITRHLAELAKQGTHGNVPISVDDGGKIISGALHRLVQSIIQQANEQGNSNQDEAVCGIWANLKNDWIQEAQAIGQAIAINEFKSMKNVAISRFYPEASANTFNGGPKKTVEPVPEEHAWITCMEQFSSNLQQLGLAGGGLPESIHRKADRIGPVHVALIDDGVAIQELPIESPVGITGYSCHTHPGNPTCSRPHYQSSGGHGTTMAIQIYRICPKVRLHIIKLEDHTNYENKKRYITPKSAAQVGHLLGHCTHTHC